MLKNVFGGIMVGIANIIPGVSGGTMMVILGLFDDVMNAVSNVFKKENHNRISDVKFLGQVLIGAGIGLVGFANVVAILLENYKYQTMWWFSGLIILSLPGLMKSELKGNKLSAKYVVLGLMLIAVLVYLNPGKVEYDYKTLVYPELSISSLVILLLVGAIAGATMLFPGISGSMALLVIGYYYLFTGYIKSVIHFDLDKIIPTAFIGLGIVFGIIVSAKVTSNLLQKNRQAIISFIVGLIIMSSIVLLPNPVLSIHGSSDYTSRVLISCLISFLVGGLIISYIEKIQGKRAS